MILCNNKRYWFAWRPVRTRGGAVVWLEVVEIHRGYQIGDTAKRKSGPWIEYTIANEVQK